MKEFLSSNNITFAYADITENMLNLKLFLKYRDNSPIFDEIKKAGRVGLPLLVVNDGEKLFLSPKEDIILDQLR